MRRIRRFAAVLAASLCLALSPAGAAPAGADPALVAEGRALVTAGDCEGCHGFGLQGGTSIKSPMGKIYVSNITPDRATGIGDWSLDQFRTLLRKGRSPRHNIYPAMPYTSFTGLSDDQIKAIYSYLMLGVKPVSKRVPRTDLPFPFVRPAMTAWNALFLTEGRPIGAVPVTGAQRERGRLLVETLGHCTACHTPRGMMMQQRSDRHLSGGMEAGWWAPNITSDPSGIGTWSDAQLATFLTTGHTRTAVAGDDMGIAVSRSLSKLPPADIAAIIAYLRAVPHVAIPVPQRRPELQKAAVAVAEVEPATDLGWQKMIAHDTTRGDILYQSACASCHGVDGNGSVGGGHPSLRLVQGVVSPHGATLVHAIAAGVDRRVGSVHAHMPAFRESFSDAQIAAIANYVRTNFAGIDSDITPAQVRSIINGEIGVPWPIRHAQALSIGGLIVLAIIAVLLAWWLVRRRRHHGAVPA